PPGLDNNGGEEGGAVEMPEEQPAEGRPKQPQPPPGMNLNPPAFPSATPQPAPPQQQPPEEEEPPQGTAERHAAGAPPTSGSVAPAVVAVASRKAAAITLSPAAG